MAQTQFKETVWKYVAGDASGVNLLAARRHGYWHRNETLIRLISAPGA